MKSQNLMGKKGLRKNNKTKRRSAQKIKNKNGFRILTSNKARKKTRANIQQNY